MLSEETYQYAAEEFGTPVGVAHIVGYSKKKEHIEVYGIESFKQMNDELTVNYIIADAVELGLYQTLQRNIYNLRITNSRIKKETTLYKKAWELTNGNQTNNTKSREIFKTS